jgi:glyoxylase-like metal-dependent hydrolase (beta-lactamase superfamily II)/ferredoxin
MADPHKRLPNNVPGEFFVDATCINCDTCRQLAPKVFGEAHGHSFVKAQPSGEQAGRKATRALLACPTGSIGTTGKNRAKEVMEDFPLNIDKGVYLCGFNSPKSFGGNSYFVVDPAGNWLIDSPKFLPHLVERFQELGGIKYIFLTHRDDVAEAEHYANEFKAQRIIHELDSGAQAQAEILLTEGRKFDDRFEVIPTPGHTRGHCVLLYQNEYLFTGDHLAWDRDTQALEAWPDVCWYDWDEQKKSLKKLVDYQFEWVLPGHGQQTHLTREQMQQALKDLLNRL